MQSITLRFIVVVVFVFFILVFKISNLYCGCILICVFYFVNRANWYEEENTQEFTIRNERTYKVTFDLYECIVSLFNKQNVKLWIAAIDILYKNAIN